MDATTATHALAPGFPYPVPNAQEAFRAVLDAMARPGTIVDCGDGLDVPAPLQPAAGAFLLALADMDTPVWLDAPLFDSAVSPWLTFHCSSPLKPTPAGALFAAINNTGDMPTLDQFAAGTEDYPDRSATLVLQVKSLSNEEVVRLSGPGIRDRAWLRVDGLPDSFWRQWQENNALFPRGVDVVFVCGTRLAALPRTTSVQPQPAKG